MPALNVLSTTTPRATTRKSRLPAFELTRPGNAPIVVVLGGISASRHVVATPEDPSPGWWEAIVGAGRAIDTTRYRVLSVDFLDGGRGDDERPARRVTTHDQAYALRRVLDALDIRTAHAIVGASYGGMVALAFAERYGDRVRQLVVFGAAHEAHPMSTALRSVQRRIVELGIETGRAFSGLALARALAMTTYRSTREFGERFATHEGDNGEFAVEQYITHCGHRFAATWRPERFLALSLSADLHRVDPTKIRVPVTLIAARDDQIVPLAQARQLARQLGSCRLHEIDSACGHDAFLADVDSIAPILSQSLADSDHA